MAAGQPHEHARTAGPGRFALDREEDLVDGQHEKSLRTLYKTWVVTLETRREAAGVIWEAPDLKNGETKPTEKIGEEAAGAKTSQLGKEIA